jgi:hypothetical protein
VDSQPQGEIANIGQGNSSLADIVEACDLRPQTIGGIEIANWEGIRHLLD